MVNMKADTHLLYGDCDIVIYPKHKFSFCLVAAVLDR